MKLFYILKAMAQKAGLERVIADKINWLAEQGYEITLVTYEQGEHPLSYHLHPAVKVIDIDVRFFKLGAIPIYRRIWAYRQMRRLFAERLQKIVDDTNPDIIIATTYSLKVAKEIATLRTNAKKIMESHSACFSVGKEYDFRSTTVMKYVARGFDKIYYRPIKRFDILVVLTEGDKRDWSRYMDRITVIPNPVTRYPEEVPPKQLRHRILAVGRLTYQKGFDRLVEAFALIADRYPLWHIDIYGNGEDRQALQGLIDSHGLQGRINLCEPTNNIYHEYLQSDFLVLSSRYEGYPLVLNEAMSCATPCVAFRCKYGPEDAITDGVDGLLVADGDISQLAEKMAWMMTHDDERQKMGLQAREAARRYTKDAIMSRWVSLFK